MCVRIEGSLHTYVWCMNEQCVHVCACVCVQTTAAVYVKPEYYILIVYAL